jgi:hypothetical protein
MQQAITAIHNSKRRPCHRAESCLGSYRKSKADHFTPRSWLLLLLLAASAATVAVTDTGCCALTSDVDLHLILLLLLLLLPLPLRCAGGCVGSQTGLGPIAAAAAATSVQLAVA